MVPGGAYHCDCFTCTGGVYRSPELVSMSTVYNHRKHEILLRLGTHSVGKKT